MLPLWPPKMYSPYIIQIGLLKIQSQQWLPLQWLPTPPKTQPQLLTVPGPPPFWISPWPLLPCSSSHPDLLSVLQSDPLFSSGPWHLQSLWPGHSSPSSSQDWLPLIPRMSPAISLLKEPSQTTQGRQLPLYSLPLQRTTVSGTFLVAQWLRIRLAMQGTRVRAPVREDPTCRGATKPVCHNYWACALESASYNYWAHMSQLLKSVHLEPVLCKKRSHRNEKPVHRNEESPPLAATRESPRAATKTQRSQK